MAMYTIRYNIFNANKIIFRLQIILFDFFRHASAIVRTDSLVSEFVYIVVPMIYDWKKILLTFGIGFRQEFQ